MFKDKNPTAQTLPQSTGNNDAVFMGWQKTSAGDSLALYNITAKGHPSFGSTVTDKTLHTMSLAIPKTPPPQGSVKNT